MKAAPFPPRSLTVAVTVAVTAAIVTLAAFAAWPAAVTGSAPLASARPTPGPAQARSSSRPPLSPLARDEAARARERAAAFDRQARAATLASERATLAAAALAARVQQAEAALASADEELAAVRGNRLALARDLARQRAPVARLLAGLQTQVRRPPLLALLQPGTLRDAVHLRAVVAAAGPQIAERTSGLRASLARARVLEEEAARLAADRRGLQSALAARRDELASVSAAERLKALRAAGAADREAERAFLAEQARDLPTLVRRLETAPPATARPMARAAGSAPPDYRLPVAGALLAPEDGGGGRTLTLRPRPGAQVVAPAAGQIAFAGPFRGYGAIAIIEHADGWTSLVTGLERVQVAAGQPVVAGSPLGQAPLADPRIGVELRRHGARVAPPLPGAAGASGR